MPNYFPSPSEVKLEVKNEGSFSIDELEVSEINWYNVPDMAESVVKSTRAIIEPLLISHFGEGVIKEIFEHFRKTLTSGISIERAKTTNLTITLTRKP